MNLKTKLQSLAGQAKDAALMLSGISAKKRNEAILAMASSLEENREAILEANAADIANGTDAGLSPAMLDRLSLGKGRFEGMVEGLRQVAALSDPLAGTLATIKRPNGLIIKKVPVPIGLIAIIYESRPNVTADVAALCIKSGNAVILRGGKEAFASNSAIVAALKAGIARAGLDETILQFVDTTDRAAVKELVQLEGLVDLCIPRGGESLIRAVTESARIPVLKHYNGICHIFVDESADQKQALKIIQNAKCQRPGTCNAAEKVLVHEAIAEKFIPKLAKEAAKWGVELIGDEVACAYAEGLTPATEEDWHTEYLALKLTVGVIPSVKDAIDHINLYGSHHSDAILTEDKKSERLFTTYVDSAAVYVNASTRFTDGGEFGFGCEMGISTDKLHARGPVAIKELTTYKYVIKGNGQLRG